MLYTSFSDDYIIDVLYESSLPIACYSWASIIFHSLEDFNYSRIYSVLFLFELIDPYRYFNSELHYHTGDLNQSVGSWGWNKQDSLMYHEE
jgi:hypothetical protein